MSALINKFEIQSEFIDGLRSHIHRLCVCITFRCYTTTQRVRFYGIHSIYIPSKSKRMNNTFNRIIYSSITTKILFRFITMEKETKRSHFKRELSGLEHNLSPDYPLSFDNDATLNFRSQVVPPR